MLSNTSHPEPNLSEHGSSTSSSNAESEAVVELLVTSRAKRTTAGNRINSLIQKEQDELVDLVFEKEEGDVNSEEDVDFVGDEDDAGSDSQLDSSTDEEDHDPERADDDLEGEKDLEKQIRVERQKKRKAQSVFKTPSTTKKKVKVNPNAIARPRAPATAVSRPKKKSERVSWIPTSEEGPLRASSRKQTIQNKATVHLRMAEKEKQRIKQMKHMEEAENKRKAAKTPPMTQVQRMVEAAKMERKNAKSLNQWEEAEKQKVEAMKAKLETLHSRKLTGPVISWWSGLVRWVNGKLSRVGLLEINELGKLEEQRHRSRSEQDQQELTSSVAPIDSRATIGVSNHSIAHKQLSVSATPASNFDTAVDLGPGVTFAPSLGAGGFLEGIHYYASLPSQSESYAMTAIMGQKSSTSPHRSTTPPQPISEPQSPVPIEHPAAFVEKPTQTLNNNIVFPRPKEPSVRLRVEVSSRNLVALRNIDSSAMSLSEIQTSVLLKKRSGRPQSGCRQVLYDDLLTTRYRTGSRAMRNLRIASEVPRPKDWSRIF